MLALLLTPGSSELLFKEDVLCNLHVREVQLLGGKAGDW